MPPLARCEGCGQLCAADAAWTVRGLCSGCRKGQYGGDELHQAPPLFKPEPAQIPGQLAMDE